MYGFETEHLAEMRGTCIPSTDLKESGKGHWAGDWKARMTLDNGLNFSGSQFPLPKTEIIDLNYSKHILCFQKLFLTSMSIFQRHSQFCHLPHIDSILVTLAKGPRRCEILFFCLVAMETCDSYIPGARTMVCPGLLGSLGLFCPHALFAY